MRNMGMNLQDEARQLVSNEQVLFNFELEALWGRYNSLRERDYENHNRLIRLFSLLIVYASAPFTLQAFSSTDFIRVWGLGGIWLALSVWFIADRDFRAYGVHLKERVYCLLNLAILREVLSVSAPFYKERILLPIGRLYKRIPASRSTFPERISASQISVASYFFKFTSLFPFLYLFIFIGFLIFPGEMLSPGDQRTIVLFLRIVLACALLLFAWVWSSAHRCLELQKLVFTARRISRKTPWPVFPDDEIRPLLTRTRNVTLRLLLLFAGFISIANIARGLELLRKRNLDEIWVEVDWTLLHLTLLGLISLYSFHEVDIRSYLRHAQKVFPLAEGSQQNAFKTIDPDLAANARERMKTQSPGKRGGNSGSPKPRSNP